MNDVKQRILHLLEKKPYDRGKLVATFPKKDRAKANATLTALIIGNKVGIANGEFFLLSEPSKMHNKKVEIDGHKFDSVKEGERYGELKVLVRALKIKDLKCHPRYKIVDRVKFMGKTLRSRYYEPDFEYIEGGITVCEDVKSEHTIKDPVYTLKRQLFLLKYPDIDFRELL